MSSSVGPLTTRHLAFDDRLALLIGVACTLLLLLPKINLVSVAGQNAGIRLDDLILLTIGAAVLFGHVASRRAILRIERTLALLFLLGVLSVLGNAALFTLGSIPLRANLFYPLRLIEYFVFFYGGMALVRFGSLNRFLAVVLLFNALVMVLQYGGWIGAFSVSGYASTSSDRVRGLVAHPAELGLFLNLLFCGLLFSPAVGRRAQVRHYVMALALFLLVCGLMGITGSRIASASLVVVFLGWLSSRESRWPLFKQVVNGLLLLVLVAAVPLGLRETALAGRSSALVSAENLRLPLRIYDEINPESVTYASIQHGAGLRADDFDLSLWMRLNKWAYVVKVFLQRPICWLLGIGPGACGPALDGSWLRILVEQGVVGFFLYTVLFCRLAHIGPVLFWSVVAFAMNMLFIDSHLSYKPMALLFLMAGYYSHSLSSTSASRVGSSGSRRKIATA